MILKWPSCVGIQICAEKKSEVGIVDDRGSPAKKPVDQSERRIPPRDHSLTNQHPPSSLPSFPGAGGALPGHGMLPVHSLLHQHHHSLPGQYQMSKFSVALRVLATSKGTCLQKFS